MGKYLKVAASVPRQPSRGGSGDSVSDQNNGQTVIDGRIAVEIVHRSEHMTWFIDKDGNHWRYFYRLRKSFPITVEEPRAAASGPTPPTPTVK